MGKNVCWCCGSKLIDSSRLMNKRVGFTMITYRPTGKLVCPYECPSKEEAEEQKKEAYELYRESNDRAEPMPNSQDKG